MPASIEARFNVCAAYSVFAGRAKRPDLDARLARIGFKAGLGVRQGRLDRNDWPEARAILARLLWQDRARTRARQAADAV